MKKKDLDLDILSLTYQSVQDLQKTLEQRHEYYMQKFEKMEKERNEDRKKIAKNTEFQIKLSVYMTVAYIILTAILFPLANAYFSKLL